MGVGFPGFGALAGRNDGGCTAGVEGSVGGDAGDRLIERNLLEQLGRDGLVTNIAGA